MFVVCSAIKGHDYDPTAVRDCVDVHCLCYHQRLCRCSWSGLTAEAVLMSEAGPASHQLHIRESRPCISAGQPSTANLGHGEEGKLA